MPHPRTGDPPALLKTNNATNPIGVDDLQPRFQWRPQSTHTNAFQVIVADSQRMIRKNTGNVWDSGRIDRSDAIDIVYNGPLLESNTRYYWKVRTWDELGDPSDWSTQATWETGLTDPDDWEADWIAAGSESDDDPAPNPYVRRSFSIDSDVEHARLHVASAGFFEASLNGDRVGDAVLDTAITDYEERVLYTTLDVTSLVRHGENTLGLVGGRGRYAMTTENVWAWHDTPWQSDEPHLRAQLEVTDGDGDTTIIGTGPDWDVTSGGTRFDSLYAGEHYDAREEPSGWTDPTVEDGSTEWHPVTVVDGPSGRMSAQQLPPMTEVRSISPTERTDLADGVSVYTFDEMIAGWAKITLDAPTGAEVIVRYGERLSDDGRVSCDQGHDPPLIDATIQADRYVASGDGPESWTPRFSYKGFRYLEVHAPDEDCDVHDVTASVVYTPIDVGSESNFSCSDPLLMSIHENTRRALLENHHGIPTDTPVYEKNGWTGDAQLTAETALYNFEMARFYRKWLADFVDAQRDTGEIPPIVPTSDWGYSDEPKDGSIVGPLPGFDAAFVLLPWWMFTYEGDKRTLARYFDDMVAYVDYLGTYEDDGIVSEGLGDWYSPLHGERKDPRGPEGPALVGTAYYYRMVDILEQAGRLLGRDNDAEHLATKRDKIGTAFNEAFLEDGVYRTGEIDEYRQTSNVLSLAFGLVPDDQITAVVEGLVTDIVETHETHLNTGIHGTKHLLPVLTENGHVDLAYELATQTTYPSWGAWIKDGASSLYEAWELDSRSLNHHFKGSVDDWFYQYLTGLTPAEPGWRSVDVTPHLPSDLDAVEATVDTVRGPVTSAWNRRDDGGVTHELSIPKATTATVALPRGTRPVSDSDGDSLRDLGVNGDRQLYEVGPGTWRFSTAVEVDQ